MERIRYRREHESPYNTRKVDGRRVSLRALKKNPKYYESPPPALTPKRKTKRMREDNDPVPDLDPVPDPSNKLQNISQDDAGPAEVTEDPNLNSSKRIEEDHLVQVGSRNVITPCRNGSRRVSLRPWKRNRKYYESPSPPVPAKLKAKQIREDRLVQVVPVLIPAMDPLPVPTSTESETQKLTEADDPAELTESSHYEVREEDHPVLDSDPIPVPVLHPDPTPTAAEMQNTTEAVGSVKLTESCNTKVQGDDDPVPDVLCPIPTPGTSEAAGSGKLDDSPNPGSAPDMRVGRVNIEENRYEISQIVDYKLVDSDELFCVKWNGWDSKWNSWEPPEHVDRCEDLMRAFFRRSPAKHSIYKHFHRKKRADLARSKRIIPIAASKDPTMTEVSEPSAHKNADTDPAEPQQLTCEEEAQGSEEEPSTQCAASVPPALGNLNLVDRSDSQPVLASPPILTSSTSEKGADVTLPPPSKPEVNQKRPRGRPRKYTVQEELNESNPGVSRKRSRAKPRKVEFLEELNKSNPEVNQKRPRGRPRKVSIQEENVEHAINFQIQLCPTATQEREPTAEDRTTIVGAAEAIPVRNQEGDPVQSDVGFRAHAEPPSPPDSSNSTSSVPDIAVGLVDPTQNIYYVEGIVDYKVEEKGEFYLVKWEGWTSEWNSWETPENVSSCPIWIKEFFERNPDKLKIREDFLLKKQSNKKKSIRKEKKDPNARDPDPDSGLAASILPDQAEIDNVQHLLHKKSNKYYPIVEEEGIKDRKVQKIFDHHQYTEYLVRFEGESSNKRAWIRIKDARKYCRIKLAIFQQIVLLNQGYGFQRS